MGRRPKSPKPPTPIAPPAPAEEIDAEMMTSKLRERMVKRAGRGAYITKDIKKLGGRERPTQKQTGAVLKEIDPLKGFETPTKKQIGTHRGKPIYESDLNFEVRAREEEAKFLEKGATSAGVEELKGFESFKREKYAQKGSIKSRQIQEDKRKYSKYLADYLDAAKGRIKRQYSTTQLRNLGLR